MTTAVMTCVIFVTVAITIFITFTHSISVHRKDLEAQVPGEIRKEKKKMESRKEKEKKPSLRKYVRDKKAEFPKGNTRFYASHFIQVPKY